MRPIGVDAGPPESLNSRAMSLRRSNLRHRILRAIPKPLSLTTGLGLLILPAFGCNWAKQKMSTESAPQAAALLLPNEITVVVPFTRFADFDGTPGIDGIELCVQPLNAFGEPTRLAGSLRVELLSFVGPSGDPRGDQLAQWEIQLATKADQDSHWNRATRMYQFHLDVDRSSLEPESKYVLELTATDAFGSHSNVRYVIVWDPARSRGAPK